MSETIYPNYLQRLVEALRLAFEPYEAVPEAIELESWAILIHESMSGRGRNFHSVQHVFDVAGDSDDRLLVLAALFHDTVYYQVDGGLPIQQQRWIASAIVEHGPCVSLAPFDPAADRRLALVARVFGFSAGQTLDPLAGLNEFLSALLAARCLGEALPLPVLAEFCACIEGTIPFRAADADGCSAAELLYARLVEVDRDFGLQLGEQRLMQAVHRAVELANRDVGNFAHEEVAWFLDNTWNMLPESNLPLRLDGVYSIGEFQLALKKMEGFFGFLDPQVVFGSFRDQPAPDELQAMTDGARQNLVFGRAYLRAKLAGVTLLAALAEKTGGDAPMSLFMGDLPGHGYVPMRLEDQLVPATDFAPGCQPRVYELLAVGRRSESKFDLRNSPLSAYLYARMGDPGVDRALACADHPMTAEHAQAYLDAIPRDVLSVVAKASARIALTRADALYALAG